MEIGNSRGWKRVVIVALVVWIVGFSAFAWWQRSALVSSQESNRSIFWRGSFVGVMSIDGERTTYRIGLDPARSTVAPPHDYVGEIYSRGDRSTYFLFKVKPVIKTLSLGLLLPPVLLVLLFLAIRWVIAGFSAEKGSSPTEPREVAPPAVSTPSIEDVPGSIAHPVADTVGEPRGVGGWLAWLILAMCLIGPLVSYKMSQTEFQSLEMQNPTVAANAAWQGYRMVGDVAHLLCLGILIAGGLFLLLRHRRSSVYIAIGALWLANFGIVISDYMSARHFLSPISNGGSEVGAAVVTGLVSASLIAGIWTAYLLASDRVRNTYL